MWWFLKYNEGRLHTLERQTPCIFLFSKTEMVQVFVGDEREYDDYKGF